MAHPELKQAYRGKAGVVHEGRLAMPCESGHLAIFDLSDGSLLFLHQGRTALLRTAVADGRLLVATGDGTLLICDPSGWKLT